ncbi:hypothetical protein ACODT3_23535 [Streptomyces sp. 4.24]|uniref:hypothetical protein n=1 Tax=Streptomyces tritrimontium TaxID=3406573 RepID=UPI003BB75C55
MVAAIVLAVVWITQGTDAAESAASGIAGIVIAVFVVWCAISAVVDWVKKNLL